MRALVMVWLGYMIIRRLLLIITRTKSRHRYSMRASFILTLHAKNL